MRMLKQYLAMLMALVIAVTSINMPVIPAFAAETGESGVQTATATDIQDISTGVTKVEITTEGQEAKFKFTPTEDGMYEIYSDAAVDKDTYGYLYNADGNELKEDDDSGENFNFKIIYELTAGTTYIIGAKYYSSSIGSFDMYIYKIVPPTSIKMKPKATTFLAGVPHLYTCFDVETGYSNKANKSYSPDIFSTDGFDSLYIDGFRYSVWIRDLYGDYTYTDEDDNIAPYTGKKALDEGTYTIVLTDYTDGETVPSDTDKIYDSYTIEVQSPDVYFADRQEISETEEKTFKTDPYITEYYKFVPTKSADYIFTTSGDVKSVYDSDCNILYSSDSKYTMEKDKTYYVGLSGDDGDGFYEVTARAKEYSEAESAVLDITDTDYMSGQYAGFSDKTVTITFKNGETESLELSYSRIYDSLGSVYYVYYAKEGEAWNANPLRRGFSGEKGKYTISVSHLVNEEEVKLCSKDIEFKSVDEFDIPELVAGENEITSGEGSDEKYYKFTMPYDGGINVSDYGCMTIYELSENGTLTRVSDKNNLTGNKTYYAGFNGSCWNSDTEQYEYTWKADVSFAPAVKTISVTPEKTVAIKGTEVVLATVDLTYVNGDTEKREHVTESFTTDKGQRITIKYKSGDREYYEYDYYLLPVGTAVITFNSSNGVKAEYDVDIKNVNDVVVATMTDGENDIDVSDRTGLGIYSFKPSESGKYNISPVNGLTIYTENEDGIANISYSTDRNGSLSVLLDEGVTYFFDLSNGGIDKWGDTVYKWTLSIELPESGKVYAPVSWKLNAPADSISFMYGEISTDNVYYVLSSKFGVEITYSNGSTDILDVYHKIRDSYDNRLEYKVLKLDASDGTYSVYDPEYEDLPVGEYKLQLSLYSKDRKVYDSLDTLEVPFAVKTISNISDGDWNINDTLTVTNDKSQYIYKLVGTENVNSITFISSTTLSGMKLLDNSGREVTMTSQYFAKLYSYSYSVDIDADKTYYICINPSDSNEVSKIQAVKNESVMGISVKMSKKEFWAGIDDIDYRYITSVITYSDGTQRTLTGYGTGAVPYIKDGENNSIGYRACSEGTYEVSAKTPNMSSNCIYENASIVVNRATATDAMDVFDPDKALTVDNADAYIQTKLFAYKAAMDQILKIDVDGEADIRVLRVDDGEVYREVYGSDGSTYELEKDNTYVIAVDIQANGSAEINATVTDTSVREINGGKLTLATTADAAIEKAGDVIVYTFIPEETGEYVCESIGSYDTYGYLYYEDSQIDSDDDGGDSNNFRISETLEKGKEYTYKVKLLDKNGTGSFKVKISKPVYKNIAEVGFDKDYCSVTKNGTVYNINCNIIATYTDATRSEMSIRYTQITDKYNNSFSKAVTYSEEDGVEYATIEVRYKNYGDTEWTSIESLKVKVIDITPVYDGVLTEGETFIKIIDSNSKGHYKFTPEKSEKFNIFINGSRRSYLDIRDIDSGDYYYNSNGVYSLTGGITYDIDVSDYMGDIGTEMSILVSRLQAVAEVTVTDYTEKIYHVGDDVYDSKYAKATVTFADGNTEIIDGNTSLQDGRSVEYSWSSEDANGAILSVKVDGVTGFKKFMYSSLEDVAETNFVSDVATLHTEYTNNRDSVKTVFRIIIPKTGVYSILDADSAKVVLYRGSMNGVTLNSEKKYTLKEGDICTICVYSRYENNVKFGCVGDITWEIVTEPTCTEKGLKRTWDELAGEYITEDIPALGHEFTDNWTLKTAASTIADGSKVLVCDRCSEESTDPEDIQTIAKIKDVTLAYDSCYYNGKAKEPVATATDADGKTIDPKNYTVEYKDNTETGTATVTVTFKGDYTGTVEKTFEIKEKVLNWETTKLPTCTEAGEKTAYDDEFDENIIEEIPALGHSFKNTWKVKTPSSMTADGSRVLICDRCSEESTDPDDIQTIAKIKDVTLAYNSCYYNGEAKTPEVTVVDSADKTIDPENYAVEYKDNTETGTATVTVTFKGDYAGTVEKTFEIKEKILIWKETKAPTCTEAGEKEAYDDELGKTVIETVPALGHDFSEEWTLKQAATTEADGIRVHKCIRCDVVNEKDTQAIAKIKDVTLAYDSCYYNGEAKTPEVTVVDSADKTIDSSNYTVEYKDNTEIGTATVTVTFKGDYEGTVEKTFEIKEKVLNWEITKLPNCTEAGEKTAYDDELGKYVTEEIPALDHRFTNSWKVKTAATMESDGSKILVCDRCGEENEDTVRTIIKIKSVTLSTDKYTYDGTSKQPAVVVTDEDDKIVDAGYYTVDYKNNVEIGTATVTVTFKEDYEGTVEKTFEIIDSGLKWETVTSPTCTDDGQKKAYNEETGEYEYEIIPATGHKYADKWLVKVPATEADSGFKVKKCITCGYEDTDHIQTIAQIKSVILEYASCKADGTAKEPSVTLLDTNDIRISSENYSVEYKNNISIGTATVEIKLSGDYSGTLTKSFNIVGEGVRVEKEEPTCTRAGYIRKYDAQTGDLISEEILSALGHNYSDTFYLKKAATTDEDGSKERRCSKCLAIDNSNIQIIYKIQSVELDYVRCGYTATEKRPGIIVKDSKDNIIDASNYSVEYKNNISTGTATAVIQFKGDYSGRVEKTFEIVSNELKWEITKDPTCTTKGEKRALNPITGLWESQFIPAKGHSFGSEWKLKTAATTTSDGKRVHICGICGAEDLANAQAVSRINTVTLAYSTVTYNGKDQEPEVTVKDAQGKVVAAANYTVAYKNNRNAGTATVTVTFKGDYTGTVTRTFTIKANAVKVASTAIKTVENVSGGVKLTWKKASGVNGYYVYRQTGKGKFVKIKTAKGASSLSFKDTAAKKDGTKYTYKVCAYKSVSGKTYTSSYSSVKATCYVSAPKCKSVSNVKGKKMKVVYSKNSKATGYQIQYSVKSSFKGAKTVKVKGAKNVSKVISKLAKGKKYYVRIRVYKVSGGKTYTSAWSTKKTISIKK